MDKQKNGKTITIKINGENHPFIVEQTPNDYESNGYNESKPTEVQAQPDGFQEAAASQEVVEESFDWILPEAEAGPVEVGTYKQANTTPSKKNKLTAPFKNNNTPQKGALKSILLSTVFAILIGTSFGILMLKLVVANPSKQTVVETQAQTPVSTAGATVGNRSEKAVLKPFTAYVVQEGVYSSKASANGIAKLAMGKQVPAGTIEINGQHFLFLGVANSIEEAKGMEKLYKEKGVGEPYSKALEIPEKTFTSLTQDEKMFIEAAPGYFSILSNVTARAMITASVPADLQKTLTTAAINDQGLKNKNLKGLEAALSGANDQLKTYQKSKDFQNLLKAQQQLLTFLSLYYSL